MHAPTPITHDFSSSVHNGRCQIVGIGLPDDLVLIVVNLYGWTGGHQDTTIASRTDQMLQFVFTELEAHPQVLN